MEALGVAANIIAVVQITENVITACYQYYRTAKDTKKDILAVINVVGGLKTTLENLRMLLDKNDTSYNPQLVPHLKSLDGTLKKCGESGSSQKGSEYS